MPFWRAAISVLEKKSTYKNRDCPCNRVMIWPKLAVFVSLFSCNHFLSCFIGENDCDVERIGVVLIRGTSCKSVLKGEECVAWRAR